MHYGMNLAQREAWLLQGTSKPLEHPKRVSLFT